MGIVETIRRLLQLKKSCTINEIASICGKKKADVLTEITDNIKLLKVDKKGGITGFINVVAQQRTTAFNNGKCYVAKQSYYIDKELECKNEKADELRVIYRYSAYNQTTSGLIKDTEENRNKLEEMGIININKIETHNIEYFWNHPNLVINLLNL